MKKPIRFGLAVGVLSIMGFWLLTPTPSHAQTRKIYGMELPPYAKEISEGRYASHTTFKKTIKYFKKQRSFRKKKVKWLEPVTLMGVKYVHVRNLDTKSKWSGMNIYELKGRKVRFFVMPRHKKGS